MIRGSWWPGCLSNDRTLGWMFIGRIGMCFFWRDFNELRQMWSCTSFEKSGSRAAALEIASSQYYAGLSGWRRRGMLPKLELGTLRAAVGNSIWYAWAGPHFPRRRSQNENLARYCG